MSVAEALPEDLQAVAPIAGRRRGYVWLFRRLLVAALTLLLVSILIFGATQALPSDPARAILGRGAPTQEILLLRKQLGLDQPLATQYVNWLGHAVRLDFGNSLSAQIPVTKLIGARVGNSALLLGLTGVLMVPLAIMIGVVCALYRGRLVDHGVQVSSFIGNAVPDFVVGTVLVALFSTVVFRWLPAVSLVSSGSPLSQPATLVLPVATLLIVTLPYLTRLVRGSMLDVLQSHYIEVARLNGIAERRILVRHVLPNALVPAIQGTAAMLAYVAGGIVIVEYLFNYPGIGSELITAIGERDLPVIQACVLILAAVYVVLNLIADILTVVVTPRLRTAARN
jgi:peptide/nickel transport system permease protein